MNVTDFNLYERFTISDIEYEIYMKENELVTSFCIYANNLDVYVGCSLLHHDCSIWEYSQLEIKEPFREKGIGTYLLKKSIEHIKKTDCVEIIGNIVPESKCNENEEGKSLLRLISLYKKNGFTIIPPTKNLCETDEEKKLYDIFASDTSEVYLEEKKLYQIHLRIKN